MNPKQDKVTDISRTGSPPSGGTDLQQRLIRILPGLCRKIGSSAALIRWAGAGGGVRHLRAGAFQKEWNALLPRGIPRKGFGATLYPLDRRMLICASLGPGEAPAGLCAFVFPDGESADVMIACSEAVDRAARALSRLFPSAPKDETPPPEGWRAFPPALRDRLKKEGADPPCLAPRSAECLILQTRLNALQPLLDKLCETPAAALDLMNHWLGDLIRELQNSNGIYSKVEGAGFIAFFGPPFFDRDPEDLCEQAIACTEDLLRATRRLGEATGLDRKLQEAGLGESLQCSSALHWGRVSLGLLGPGREYSAFSGARNHCGRLLREAAPGEVLVSAGVIDHLRGGSLGIAPRRGLFIDFAGPWDVPVDNLTHPLEYYRCSFNKEVHHD